MLKLFKQTRKYECREQLQVITFILEVQLFTFDSIRRTQKRTLLLKSNFECFKCDRWREPWSSGYGRRLTF